MVVLVEGIVTEIEVVDIQDAALDKPLGDAVTKGSQKHLREQGHHVNAHGCLLRLLYRLP